MWVATSEEREEQFQALYFPVYRGLMGMRLSIIRQDNIDDFSRINTLSDLTKIKAGQGTGWTNGKILAKNGISVVETRKTKNLFYMLEGGRFSFFPRGIIYDPWKDVESYPDLNLAVDPKILIQYELPMYFFVNKANTALEKKLTKAFNEIVANGEFFKLFFADPEIRKAFELSDIRNRHLIKLTNPFLTNKTPISRKELWFNPLTGK